MSDLEDDLRSTGDSVIRDARRLTDVEAEKAARGPADPRVPPLADEAVELADEMLRKTRIEHDLAERIARERRRD